MGERQTSSDPVVLIQPRDEPEVAPLLTSDKPRLSRIFFIYPPFQMGGMDLSLHTLSALAPYLSGFRRRGLGVME